MVRSLRSNLGLPSVSVVMGAIMCVSSQLNMAVRYTAEVYTTGLGLIVLGAGSWVLIQIYNVMRIRNYQKLKLARASGAAQKPENSRSTSLRSSRF